MTRYASDLELYEVPKRKAKAEMHVDEQFRLKQDSEMLTAAQAREMATSRNNRIVNELLTAVLDTIRCNATNGKISCEVIYKAHQAQAAIAVVDILKSEERKFKASLYSYSGDQRDPGYDVIKVSW